MQVSNAYVYFVYRTNLTLPICCSDLIGKVGKGTGKRMDAYRTPYGSDNLAVDVWNCDTEQDALALEGLILDILDMRGWIRYHASKNNKKRNRAEVVSFPFLGKNQTMMIREYKDNMIWIHNLITHYHTEQNHRNVSSSWNKSLQLTSQLKGKVINSMVQENDITIFDTLGYTSNVKNIERYFQGSVSLKNKNNQITISIKEKRDNRCSVM